MNVGTAVFQMFLWVAVAGLLINEALELEQARFRRQYQKGKWVLPLVERGYLRRIL